MAGSIDQVQDILLAVLMFIIDLYRMALDGNALLSFKVHIIKYLVHHITVADGAGALQKTVSQGGFAMVNMCDNAKITDVLHVRLYLIFRGGEGNEKRRERRDYVAGFCTLIEPLLRRSVQGSVILFNYLSFTSFSKT
jgi:hypothetical protein